MIQQGIINKVSRKRAIIEVCLLYLGIACYLAAAGGGLAKRWVIAALSLLLAFYIVSAVLTKKESAKDYGLRFDNFSKAAIPALLFTFLGVVGLLAFLRTNSAILWRKSMMGLTLLLYPAYGIAQQAVFQGILHRRLCLLFPTRVVPILITSVSFALVHIGDLTLVMLTFVAGLCWSILFQRLPNVLTLGISHGILAAFAYPLLIGKIPLRML